jgi:hypothetical protein
MTRIYEIENDEFDRIEKGIQSFIVLPNDKKPIAPEDTIILQHIPASEEDGVKEVKMIVSFFLTEGLKKGFVLCALKEPTY